MLIICIQSNTIKSGNIHMGFKFQPDKKRETLNKTIRFPKELVERIEKQVADSDSYFSSFVIQACEYAVRDVEAEYQADKKEETD